MGGVGTADAVEFRVLGPVEVRDHGEVLPVGPPRVRAVLGVLLVRPGALVSVDRLVDELWPDAPPADARALVHGYVSRLRRALRQGRTAGDRLVTRKPGYLLRVDGGLDLHRYEELLALARRAHRAGDQRTRLALLRQAEGMWRGAPFADVPPTPGVAGTVATLTELRRSAYEDLVDAALDTGRHAELIPELTEMHGAHPLRERLVAQYMTALHRSGRTADALAVYQRARTRLADDLGIDPGVRLRELHQRILTADPALDAPSSAAPSSAAPSSAAAPSPAAVPSSAASSAGGRPTGPTVTSGPPPARIVPAQLPADLGSFTGRATELDRLLALTRTDPPPATVTICAVDGMAGVGKTALAVHAAHVLADRFPDGQLFLNLHGHTPGGVAPVDPAEALDRLLRALGVSSGEIPRHLDDRAALYRSRLAGTRTLLVLDNAHSEAQVRPLLPASAGCLVLVTSRRRLTGLDDHHPLSLDVMPATDAVALFAVTAQVGPDAAVERVVELCGRLPLAIRIAAARLRNRPMTPADLAELLPDQRYRLSELEAGQRSVAAAFSLSYADLTDGQQRTFRLLGLHPGVDVDTHAVAALTGAAPRQARRDLDDLVDTHLITHDAPGRYRFHDLLRDHALLTAQATDTAADRRAALTRLFTYYAYTSTVATDLAYPDGAAQRPRPCETGEAGTVGEAGVPTPGLGDATAAKAWLDTEMDNLIAAAEHAAAHGWPGHALHQSATLYRHLRSRASHHGAGRLHEAAVAAARSGGDAAGEARALTALGETRRMQNRYDEAVEHFRHALTLGDQPGDGPRDEPGGRSIGLVALTGLGFTYWACSRYAEAAECFARARSLAHELGERTAEMEALVGLGNLHQLQDSYPQAAACFEQVLTTARELGDGIGQLNGLTGLGHVHRAQHDDEAAERYFQAALELAGQLGNRVGELDALVGLGWVHRVQGRHEQAAWCLHRALSNARTIGSRNWEFEALNGLGALHQAAGRYAEALAVHQEALAVVRSLRHTNDQARTHHGLALAHCALGDGEQARNHWLRALDILASQNARRTEDETVNTTAIRAHLADLGSPGALVDPRCHDRPAALDGR